MAPSSSRARNSVMKIGERSSLKILPSPNTTDNSFLWAENFSKVISDTDDYCRAAQSGGLGGLVLRRPKQMTW